MIFIGFKADTKDAYILYNPVTKREAISRHVEFDENYTIQRSQRLSAEVNDHYAHDRNISSTIEEIKLNELIKKQLLYARTGRLQAIAFYLQGQLD